MHLRVLVQMTLHWHLKVDLFSFFLGDNDRLIFVLMILRVCCFGEHMDVN